MHINGWKLQSYENPEEAVSNVLFYRGGAEAQRNKTLIFNPLRLCVFAVIFNLLTLKTPSYGLK
jgi:hypothetical protein